MKPVKKNMNEAQVRSLIKSIVNEELQNSELMEMGDMPFSSDPFQNPDHLDREKRMAPLRDDTEDPTVTNTVKMFLKFLRGKGVSKAEIIDKIKRS